MRVAAIYDIHGNLPALEAVLRDIRLAGVDEVLVGGDVVPGPMPNECIAALLNCDVPVRVIRGNGERVVLDTMAGLEVAEVPPQYRGAIRWTAEQLLEELWVAMRSWPTQYHNIIDGLGMVHFCHATPRNDTEVFTRRTPDSKLMPVFQHCEAVVVVCGHTHMQFDRRIGETRIVNAGSVGMPYGEPGAYWLILGPGVNLRRTPYDFEKAAERIRETGYPLADEFAKGVLCPHSEQEMLELFASFELS